MSVHQLVLLLSWDVECSLAWGGSQGSGHRACPPAAATLRSQVLPSTATPQGKPASALHHPLLPPAPASSLHHRTFPPAPRPSQHLPHSPLPTSSTPPRLQELTHSLPQPPTAPGPPARQLSCLWTRGSAQAMCHVQPHTAMPRTHPRQGDWSASPSMSPPAWHPSARSSRPRHHAMVRSRRSSLVHPCILSFSTPVALRPPCKTQSGER